MKDKVSQSKNKKSQKKLKIEKPSKERKVPKSKIEKIREQVEKNKEKSNRSQSNFRKYGETRLGRKMVKLNDDSEIRTSWRSQKPKLPFEISHKS